MARYDYLIDQAIDYIGDGFVPFAEGIVNAPTIDVFLITHAFKARRFIDALRILQAKDYSGEALPILRSLVEVAVNMRWVQLKDTDKRLDDYYKDFEKREIGKSWTNTSLLKRMKDIGFDEPYYNWVVGLCNMYVHANATSMTYGGIIEGERDNDVAEEAISAISAQMLGHVLYALNQRYEGRFDRADEIWRQIEGMSDPPLHPGDLFT